MIGALPEFENTILRRFYFAVVVGEGCERHGNFVRVGADRLQIVFMREKCVRGADKVAPQIGSHGIHDVLLPEKTMSTARAEVSDAEPGNTSQSLNFVPQLCFRPGIQNVEAELA